MLAYDVLWRTTWLMSFSLPVVVNLLLTVADNATVWESVIADSGAIAAQALCQQAKFDKSALQIHNEVRPVLLPPPFPAGARDEWMSSSLSLHRGPWGCLLTGAS